MDAKCFGMLITELPPGSMSGLHQHSFEAAAYVLEGEGQEVIGDLTIDWKAGDTFYLPPNVPHRHVNRSKDKVARFIQIESWPLSIFLGLSRLDQFEPAGKIAAE
jgi:gentisate 1,2-dioxygenase